MVYRKVIIRKRKPAVKGRRIVRRKFVNRKLRIMKPMKTYASNQMFVKLPWTYVFTNPLITSGSSLDIGFVGNGLCSPLQPGNAQTGDKFPLGLMQYAGLYNRYRVMGSKIRISINNAPTTPAGRPLFFSFTSASGVFGNGTAPIYENYNKLVSQPLEDMISYPGSQYRIISGALGNKQNVFFKSYVNTSKIMGIKDVKDNEDCVGNMPHVDNSFNGSNPATSGQWFWLLRTLPQSTTDYEANNITYIVKITYYIQLLNRDVNGQYEVPA